LLWIAAFLLVPLALRYATSWHMAQLRLRLLRGDEDLRQLQLRFAGVRQDVLDTRSRLRQYQVRKDHIRADIRRERGRLEELRAGRDQRLAA
jgi:hypothetical protein